jgi:TolB-like protein/tetratricopeptide (TPR) repeat protein
LAFAGTTVWLAARAEDPAPAVTADTTEKPSIAVLPLANLSTEPADAVLADGMTQEVIAILGRNEELKVIASTSVFAFRNTSADVRAIADSLGVSHVLEGAFRKIGSRLRIQVRLVDASDGSTRWSETYDRELEDLFSIQEDIARAVANELDVRLTGDPGTRLQRGQTSSVAAYEFYLRGSDDALRRSDSGLRQAVGFLRQAVAADSTYAAPYAALARLYMNLSRRPDPGMTSRAFEELAEQAALKAIALDDSLAEGHASLGFIRWFVDYDVMAAGSELERAVAVDPTHGLSHAWLAQLYLRTGRAAEALAEARRALENDPLSPIANAEVAHALLANGRYDEALALLKPMATLQPPLYRVALYEAQAYAKKGMWIEAIGSLRPLATDDLAASRSNGRRLGDPANLSLYGYVLARAGRREEALRIREALLDRARNGTGGAFDVVTVEVGLGDFDQAFAWLERAIDDRSTESPTFHIMEPIFDELRQDPRFERLRPRLGIQNR